MLTSHNNDDTSSSSDTASLPFDLFSPSFAALTLTVMSIVFVTSAFYYVIKRTCKLLWVIFRSIFVPLNDVQPLGSVG